MDHTRAATMGVVTPSVPDKSDSFDGGPVAALRRIAFLLERSRAETAGPSAPDSPAPVNPNAAVTALHQR